MVTCLPPKLVFINLFDVRRADEPCPTCGEPLEVHGSGERFPCQNGGGYFVEMEDGE
jgi:hypothetical protein